MSEPLLEVEDLHITYRQSAGDIRAVSGVSFDIGADEYFGVVGESGCGKSTLGHAIMDGLDSNGEISSGTIRYKGREIQDLSDAEFTREIRAKEIAIIPQSAMNSLNPLSRVSEQAVNIAKSHTDWSEERTLENLTELFEVVGLPESRIDDYPHQFSGGMKQRAIIALSLLLEPSLLIADEPTTALDVIMQDQILQYLLKVGEVRDFSLMFITHDIAVIYELCDSVAVMHGGQLAETGAATDIFDAPRHPYTILLQRAFPDIRHPDRELEEIEGVPPSLREDVDFCTFADRCPWSQPECREAAPPLESLDDGGSHLTSCIRSGEMGELASEYLGDTREETADAGSPAAAAAGRETVLELDGLEKHFSSTANLVDTIKATFFGGDATPIQAVDGVDLDLKRNQVQGVIGESGCGKTTLLLSLMGKYDPSGGEIRFGGRPTSEFTKADWKEYRRQVQIIHQDPFNSLNPKFSVRETLMEPLRIHDMELDEQRVLDVLERVELTPPENYLHRRESQLSGGEKQRVAIARALILEPEVILADEPVSMLDVSTQASILHLLAELSEEADLSMVYVSHDLSTVSYVCDTINVMYLGRVVESAPTAELIDDPKHPYTRALIDAVPLPDPHHDRDMANLAGAPGDARNLLSGCRFKDRCPERMEICDERPLYVRPEGDGTRRQVACHLHYDHEELAEDDRLLEGAMEQ